MDDNNKYTDEVLDNFLNSTPGESRKKEKKKKKFLPFLILALCVLVVVGVILLLTLSPKPIDPDNVQTDDCAEMSLSVDKENVHQAKVETNNDGEITRSGDGTLIEVETNKVKKIDIENESGSFSILSHTNKTKNEDGDDETEDTTYTLVGYDNLDMDSGKPSAIATACANLTFTNVIGNVDNLSDFGLKKPRAIVKTEFTDKTKSVIYVGDKAPQDAGTYIRFGDSKTVYLISNETADNFTYSVLDLINLEISPKSDDEENNKVQSLVLKGKKFSDSITLISNTDECIKSSYLISSPINSFANETESTSITGNLRGTFAAEAVYLNPDDSKLEEYGLKNPYVIAEASFPDTTFIYYVSNIKDNSAYLIKKGDNIIYRVADSTVPFVSTTLDKLMPDTILSPNKEKVTAIDVKDGKNDYLFTLDTTTESVKNENDEEEEVTNTICYYKGEKVNNDDFNTFFQNLDAINITGELKDQTLLVPDTTITFSYSSGRDDDTIRIYNISDAKVAVSLNNTVLGTTYRSYIDRYVENAEKLANGESVDAM